MLTDLLLDLLFPPKCPCCKKLVAGHGDWCLDCLAGLVQVHTLPDSSRRQFLDTCWVLCRYEGQLKRLLHDIKFRSVKKYRPHFIRLLDYCRPQLLLNSIDLVVPVPLDSRRMAIRGFNQTELIFYDGLSSQFIWADVLKRERPTIPQWELGLAARRDNIRGAFAVQQADYVQDKHILLVDDILTSGITMNECARTLKKAGASRVTGLVLASGAL